MTSPEDIERKVPGYVHGPAARDVWSYALWGALIALETADGREAGPYSQAPWDLRQCYDEMQCRIAIRRAIEAGPGKRIAAAVKSVQDTNRMAGRAPALPSKEK